jgi:hypothetical protein
MTHSLHYLTKSNPRIITKLNSFANRDGSSKYPPILKNHHQLTNALTDFKKSLVISEELFYNSQLFFALLCDDWSKIIIFVAFI